MANSDHKCDHCKVQHMMLDDGRKAERHVSVDEHGNEVIEVFAEEKRPLKLEKRIVREFKQVVAKETHQSICDGEVSEVEVRSLEPEQALQVHAPKEDLQALITHGVVAGVSALMEQNVSAQSCNTVSAQSVIEQNVQEKKKHMVVNMVMVGILLAQAAFFGYVFFAL